MKRMMLIVMGGLLALAAVGCRTPSRHTKDLRLGMTPDEVKDVMGDPTVVRASKVYDDGQTQVVWEYLARFQFNAKNFWIYFENDRMVQWGQPGDFAGKSGMTVPVEDYKAVKQAR